MTDFEKQRLDKLKAIHSNVSDAIQQLTLEKVQSYELDTGQNRQKVTKLDLDNLRKLEETTAESIMAIESAYNPRPFIQMI